MYRHIYVSILIALVVCPYFVNLFPTSDFQLDDTNTEFFYNSTNTVNEIVEDMKYFADHHAEKIPEIREMIKSGSLPANKKIRFFLYNANNPNNYYELITSKNSILNSPFNPNRKVVLLLPGYSSYVNWTTHPLREVQQALVDEDKSNVFRVDYSSVCNAPYSIGFPRIYLVAKEIASFLNFLMEEGGITKEQIHVIGFSLGGQLAGAVGKAFPGLERITALDPGGMMFHFFPEDLILNRNDAKFVQAIHVNGLFPFPRGVAFYKPSGHLDFYANGGQIQPGCNSTTPVDLTPTSLAEIQARRCMHDRSSYLYAESITNKNCTFYGTICDSYENFLDGLCSGDNATTMLFGHNARKPLMELPKNAMIFFNTNHYSPYCKPSQP